MDYNHVNKIDELEQLNKFNILELYLQVIHLNLYVIQLNPFTE